jgi:hypothetical protein
MSLRLSVTLIVWACFVWGLQVFDVEGLRQFPFLVWLARVGLVIGCIGLVCALRKEWRQMRLQRIEQRMIAPGTHWFGATTGRGAGKPRGYGYVRRR